MRVMGMPIAVVAVAIVISGTSAVNTAMRQGHTHVLRVFRPAAADLDMTVFARSASPLLLPVPVLPGSSL